MDWSNLTWKCMVCGDPRPDAKISVHVTDQSKEYGMPDGSVKQNVRYCNDRKKCIDGAKEVWLGSRPTKKDPNND